MVNEDLIKEIENLNAQHKALEKYSEKWLSVNSNEKKLVKRQKLALKDRIAALEAKLDKPSKTAETSLPEWAADGIGV